MSRGPHDAPLGAKPILPPPSGQAASRAGRAFRDYVERLRHEPEIASAAPSPRMVSPSGTRRRYDLAWAKVGAAVVAVEESAPPAGLDPTLDAVPPPSWESDPPTAGTRGHELDAEPSVRPPPGAPTVRPSVRRAVSESLPQEILETAADSAMLSTDERGNAAFEIVFSDELFHDLACRIGVADGRVVATFRARDDNLRRLLEAEAGRLRVRLEERGLKVAEVRVELQE